MASSASFLRVLCVQLRAAGACLMLLACTLVGCRLHAQQPAQKSMGSISTADAKLSGGLEVANARARLLTNASVTAYDHTAQIDLDRGGQVQVCATSAFHLLRSGTGDALLFALDRGAMEIRTRALPQDSILTPDLRFVMLTTGPLDLRMRVTREGDTCVENHGDTAPVLEISESFGSATYHLAPNQHVMFEHGSLHEVVDKERSNCGCPAFSPSIVAVNTPNATSVASPQQAAALNPFPAAQSAGLTPEAANAKLLKPDNAAAIGISVGTASVTTPAPVPTPPAQPAPAVVTPPAAASTEPPPAPPGARDIVHKIGRFFKRLFGSTSKAN